MILIIEVPLNVSAFRRIDICVEYRMAVRLFNAQLFFNYRRSQSLFRSRCILSANECPLKIDIRADRETRERNKDLSPAVLKKVLPPSVLITQKKENWGPIIGLIRPHGRPISPSVHVFSCDQDPAFLFLAVPAYNERATSARLLCAHGQERDRRAIMRIQTRNRARDT